MIRDRDIEVGTPLIVLAPYDRRRHLTARVVSITEVTTAASGFRLFTLDNGYSVRVRDIVRLV